MILIDVIDNTFDADLENAGADNQMVSEWDMNVSQEIG